MSCNERQNQKNYIRIYFTDQIDKLTALGFSTQDCIHALERNNKKLDDAALWLTQNAVPSSSNNQQEVNGNQAKMDLCAIEVDVIKI